LAHDKSLVPSVAGKTPLSLAAQQRLEAVERALRAVAQKQLERQIKLSDDIAIAVAAAGGAEMATPRELAAAVGQAERAAVVAELAQMKQRGGGRDAVHILARRHARDPRDPVEVESLKQKYRRWWREK
jgi:hypothetical protein